MSTLVKAPRVAKKKCKKPGAELPKEFLDQLKVI